MYDTRELPLQTGGNVYYNGARPYSSEENPLIVSGIDPKPTVVEEGDSVYLQLTLGQAVQNAATTRVTTGLLGKAKIPGLAYENADSSPVIVDSDYFGKKRNEASPSAGPFENPGQTDLKLKVW
jgi:alpha-N-arabinofuranosidase